MLTSIQGFGLNMLCRPPFIYRNVVWDLMAAMLEKADLEMTKYYQKFRINSSNGGFFVGLADFACLGWKSYDLAGYPHDDENAALFSDWITLGEDVETAKEKLKEAQKS
jgi:hypothetical protein